MFNIEPRLLNQLRWFIKSGTFATNGNYRSKLKNIPAHGCPRGLHPGRSCRRAERCSGNEAGAVQTRCRSRRGRLQNKILISHRDNLNIFLLRIVIINCITIIELILQYLQINLIHSITAT
jgi:hypothetical protein